MPLLRSLSPDTEVATTSKERPAVRRPKTRGKLWRDGQKWTRLTHVYVSMVALLVVLFFSATGLTLNHPEWTFGVDPVTSTYDGSLPDGSIADDGIPAYLVISDYLRDLYDITGQVSDYGTTGNQGYISYAGPGYSADVFFDSDTGEYQVTVVQQGLIGVLNDLHKGRDTVSSWSWLIDASAILLIVVSLTGLGLQLFLSKRRRLALTLAGAGTLITTALVLVAIN